MITIATEEDIKKAVGLANGYAGQSVNESHFIEWWTRMVRAGLATVFMRESSDRVLREAIGVLIFDNPMSGFKSATVSFWYSDPSEKSLCKGILFARAFDFLKSQGCATIYCSALLNERYSTVAQFLKGYGFKENEVQFIKQV